MSKIPPRRIPSDDCVIRVGRKISGGKIVEPGTEYRVHEGEWVDVLPVTSVRQHLALSGLQRATAAGVDADTTEKAMNDFCAVVASKVLAWNWTDLDGKPLPCPFNSVETIQGLSDDEVIWLFRAIRGELPEERKKDSGPSVPSS